MTGACGRRGAVRFTGGRLKNKFMFATRKAGPGHYLAQGQGCSLGRKLSPITDRSCSLLHLLQMSLMSMIVADPASRMLAQVVSSKVSSRAPQQGPPNGRCRVIFLPRRKLPALRPAACIMSSMHTTAKREAQRVLEADFALRTAGTFQIDLLPAAAEVS